MQKVQDEKYLVSEVLSGNREAFVQLIRQYEGLVLHIVTPLVGAEVDREDICQDVFIKVYEKMDTFQNILLSNIVSPENELSFIDSINIDSDNPERIIIRKEEIAQLNQSINMLPEFQKTVLLLFYKEEMSLNEISEILEMPVNTVKSHLFRAKSTLKQLMTKKEII